MNFNFENHYRVLLEQQKDHQRESSRRKRSQEKVQPAVWRSRTNRLLSSKSNHQPLRTCT